MILNNPTAMAWLILLINQIESVQRAEYHPETVPKSPTKSPNKKTYRARPGGGDAYIGGARVGGGGALGSSHRHAASPRARETLGG